MYKITDLSEQEIREFEQRWKDQATQMDRPVYTPIFPYRAKDTFFIITLWILAVVFGVTTKHFWYTITVTLIVIMRYIVYGLENVWQR